MALVYDSSFLIDHINYSFSLCAEAEINKKLFDDYFIKNIKEEFIDGGKLNEVNSNQYLPINSSASEEEEDMNKFDRHNKKISKTINSKYVHWKAVADISDEAKNELITDFTPQINENNKSKLSLFLNEYIATKSAFSSYAAFGDSTFERPNLKEFNAKIEFDVKNTEQLQKKIYIEESCTVEQLIGYLLYLCQSQDFRMNIKKSIENYTVYSIVDSSVENIKTDALDHDLIVKNIPNREILIKYEPGEYVAKIVFFLKTSAATQESPSFNLNMNTNLKETLIRYLGSKSLPSDTGYDTYIRTTKTYIKDIDVPLISFKEQMSESGTLSFDVVYYDNIKRSHGIHKISDTSTFDLYKRASLIHKFKAASDVNVAIDSYKIEIIPLANSKSLFGKVSAIVIPTTQIISCAVKSTKSTTKKQLKLSYNVEEGTKSKKVEAAYYIIEEMNQKINDILLDNKNKQKKDCQIGS